MVLKLRALAATNVPVPEADTFFDVICAGSVILTVVRNPVSALTFGTFFKLALPDTPNSTLVSK